MGKLVKLGGPASIRPHLPELASALLESLSGLEVQFRDIMFQRLSSCTCQRLRVHKTATKILVWV